MDKQGKWKLSPAYDLCYSYTPGGKWTNSHQLSLNGKQDNFTMADLQKVGENMGIREHKQIIEEVQETVSHWHEIAKDCEAKPEHADFSEKQYEWALKLNSWNELDWIADSFTQTTRIRCGYLQCAVVPYKAANGQTIWVNFCSVLGRYEVRNLKEVDPTASYIYYNVSGKGKTNIIVRSPELAEARMCDSEKLETPARPIPSKRQKLFKNIEGTTKFAINGKEIWVEQALKDAEDKFKADIRVLANKIRERSINEENLSLLYASDDPKHIQISISDGNITLYARSIFAAANSILLSPHFRFIVTETSKTK